MQLITKGATGGFDSLDAALDLDLEDLLSDFGIGDVVGSDSSNGNGSDYLAQSNTNHKITKLIEDITKGRERAPVRI